MFLSGLSLGTSRTDWALVKQDFPLHLPAKHSSLLPFLLTGKIAALAAAVVLPRLEEWVWECLCSLPHCSEILLIFRSPLALPYVSVGREG